MQSCSTLCDPMNHSPPGSFVHEFSQQGYWSGLSFPPPGGLDPGMELTSPALQVDSLSLSHWGSPYKQSVATNLSACINLYVRCLYILYLFHVIYKGKSIKVIKLVRKIIQKFKKKFFKLTIKSCFKSFFNP